MSDSAALLERAIVKLENLKDGAFPIPWEPGVGGGDHWYLFAQDKAVVYVAANDGSDEEFREPTARLIAALSRTVDPILDFLRFARGLSGARIQGEQAAATVDLAVYLARAAFVEWLMGLPEEWVTAPDLELTRTQQLKMLGNGVVPQQALYALRLAEVAA